MSEALRNILARDLDYKVKRAFERACDAMFRELTYLEQRNDRRLGAAMGAGWSRERVRAVIVLNSFHRVVLGPLEAAYMTPARNGLGGRLPIKYGAAFSVGDRDGVHVRDALTTFDMLVTNKGIRSYWLNIGRLSDLLFALGRQDGDE